MFSIQPHIRRLAAANGCPGAPGPQRAAPPAASPDPDPPPAGDPARSASEGILRCGAAAASSTGICFGTTFALTQQWRAQGGPLRKVASAWLIVGGAALTAYTDPLARGWTGARPTAWPRASLARDAVTPAVLLTTNLLYLYSRMPKFPAGTPRSWGANLLLSSFGCGAAGAITEALAQREARTHTPESSPARSRGQLAAGRALSVVPMALVQQVPAAWLLNARKLPPALAPVPIIVGTGGWAFRRVLAPASHTEASCAGPNEALAANGRQENPKI